MLFAEIDGGGVGVPTGNLLTQIQVVLYLNVLDNFVKRVMKCKYYVRYVDDFIIFGIKSRDEANRLREQIEEFLMDTLCLKLSKYTISGVSRGINFVGFRTWRRTRFIRRHSIHNFSRTVKLEKISSIISIMGNAKHTASLKHFYRLVDEKPNIKSQLTKLHKGYKNECTNIKNECTNIQL